MTCLSGNRWLVVLMIVFAAACSRVDSAKQKNIFGNDDRVWVTSRVLPFTAVGKLNSGCTGTLVGRRLMLTAAHCVFDPATQQARESFSQFSGGLLNGQPGAVASPIHAWIGSIQPEQVRSTDWAVVELDQPIGSQLGFLDVRAVDDSATFPYLANLVGYNNDVNSGLTASVHWNCIVHQISEGRLFHSCDATSGISGGPIFSNMTGVWPIIGISVSEFRNNQAPPVHRDEWSPEYTNVGVPAKTFAGVVRTLLKTVDVGQPAPIIPEATLIDFKIEQQPQPQPQPQPTPSVPNNIGGVRPIFQISSLSVLWDHAARVQNAHGILLRDVALLNSFSHRTGSTAYSNSLAAFTSALHQHIAQWNVITQYGNAGGLFSYNLQNLYYAYVNLKNAQIQLWQEFLNLPSGDQDRISADLRLLMDHVTFVEASEFN